MTENQQITGELTDLLQRIDIENLKYQRYRLMEQQATSELIKQEDVPLGPNFKQVQATIRELKLKQWKVEKRIFRLRNRQRELTAYLLVNLETLAAQTAHNAIQAYCRALNLPEAGPDWSAATVGQRESIRRGVKFIIDNPESTPEAQHKAWMEDRLSNGWVFGLTKDEEKKTHPCLMPYHALPEQQQVKDSLFQSVVRTILGITVNVPTPHA
jgi:hypothetical protein